jgi:hypothetical protein
MAWGFNKGPIDERIGHFEMNYVKIINGTKLPAYKLNTTQCSGKLPINE